jgi:hypothetical protein
MKFPRSVAVLAAVVLALVFGAAALGQDGLLAGLVQPLVVNIEQQVPVDVTLAVPLDDGSVVTATTPITVGIALQVKIDGAGVVSVEAEEAEPKVEVVEAAPATEGPSSAAEGTALLSSNTPISMSVAGVDIEVLSLSLIPFDALPEERAEELMIYESFQDAAIVGALAVRVANNSAQPAYVRPIGSSLVVGGEQVNLMDFSFHTDGQLNQLYFAEAGAKGEILFALYDTQWEDVAGGTTVRYFVEPPTDEGYSKLSDEGYEFEVELEPAQ